MSSSRSPEPDAVVVGGGIGGLAAAIAARRAGRSVVVLERAPGPSEVDTGITLWGFAVRTLRELGIEDPDRFGAPLERIRSYSTAGELLSDIDLRSATREVGALGYDVHRAELLGALLEALGPGHVCFGAKCIGVCAGAGAATAELEDGRSVAGRVLVGADGVRSVARDVVAPDTRIQVANLGAWRGVLDLDETHVPAGVHVRIYGAAGVFGAARIDSQRVRWYAGGRVGPDAAGTWDELRGRFAGWPEPAASILEAGAPLGLLYNDTPHFRPLPRWARGRVALVGDAAHAALPTLGVSGGLALADGLALGNALVRGAGPEALQAYARRRQKVGRRIQREARGFRLVWAPRRPRVVGARDRLLAAPFDWFQRRGTAHLTRGAEAPVAAELLPTFLRPANRRIAASEYEVTLPPADEAVARSCLTALRRAAGLEYGPMELHSRRVERIALKLAAAADVDVERLVLRCASLLHDIGLYDPWWDGGPYTDASARAAQAILGPSGVDSQRLSLCCAAVRRHHALTDQSALGAEVELLRRADLIDVTAGAVSFGLPRVWMDELLDRLPRTGFARHVAWMFLRRTAQSPESARAFFLENIRRSM